MLDITRSKATMENQSKDQFREWLVNNLDKHAELTDLFSKDHIRRIITGSKVLGNLSNGKKIRLYEVTGLEFFKVDAQIHPRDMDIKSVIKGTHNRSVLELRIGYDGKNKTELAKKFGVSASILSRYISNERVANESRRKIEEGLRKIYSDGAGANYGMGEVKGKNKPTRSIGKRGYLERKIKDLKKSIEGAVSEISHHINSDDALERLASKENQTLDDRVKQINTAIDVLAENMDYFREASQKERDALIRNLDVDSWGYVTNILGKLDRPKGAETVMRLYPRPNGGN